MSHGLKLYAWKNTIDYKEVLVNYSNTSMVLDNIPYYENSTDIPPSSMKPNIEIVYKYNENNEIKHYIVGNSLELLTSSLPKTELIYVKILPDQEYNELNFEFTNNHDSVNAVYKIRPGIFMTSGSNVMFNNALFNTEYILDSQNNFTLYRENLQVLDSNGNMQDLDAVAL